MENMCLTDREYRAKYKVYFCNSDYQEKNAQLIKGCKLVDKEYQAQFLVYITDREYRADIKITRDHFGK